MSITKFSLCSNGTEALGRGHHGDAHAGDAAHLHPADPPENTKPECIPRLGKEARIGVSHNELKPELRRGHL